MEQSLFSRDTQRDAATRRLVIAVAISLALHLLIVGLWRGVRQILPAPVAVSARPEPSKLQFKFAPTDPDAERPTERRGEVQLPSPEPPRPEPPRPEQQPASTPPAGAPAAAGQQKQATAAEAFERFEDRGRAEALADRELDPGAPVAPGPDGDFVDGDGGEPLPPPTAGTPEPLALDRAVRDFARAVRQRDSDVIDSLHRQTREFRFAPPSMPAEGSMHGELEFSTPYPWSEYARQIRTAIMRAWFRRIHRGIGDFEGWASLNQYNLQHFNRIRFVIEADGDISEIELVGPSGCEPLDLSATGALADVILPALPDDFPLRRETVHVRFIAEGPIYQRGKRQVQGASGDTYWENFTDRSLWRYVSAMKQVYGF